MLDQTMRRMVQLHYPGGEQLLDSDSRSAYILGKMPAEHTELLLEVLPVAMCTCDAEGLITYFNPRAAEIWGRKPRLGDPDDRFCGSLRLFHLDGTPLPHVETPMAHAVQTGQRVRNYEVMIERPNGTRAYVSVNIEPILDQTGRQVGAINVFEDITQRKQTEDALRQARDQLEQRVAERTVELERRNRELDQFAHVASHDLRSPLRAIDMLSQWIIEDCASLLPRDSQVHLDKLRRRVRRMEYLLNDLLAYSRADRTGVLPETVDTGYLVHSIVEWVAPPPGFTVSVAREMPVLKTERVPLELVFRNLLDNALKHHHQPKLGRVHISAKRQDGMVEFAVTDNGPGIDPLFHQRIFQVLQTLSPRDKVEGSGIGLSLVKKIVEQRGGRIWLDSAIGEGTTFYITWPIEDD